MCFTPTGLREKGKRRAEASSPWVTKAFLSGVTANAPSVFREQECQGFGRTVVCFSMRQPRLTKCDHYPLPFKHVCTAHTRHLARLNRPRPPLERYWILHEPTGQAWSGEQRTHAGRHPCQVRSPTGGFRREHLNLHKPRLALFINC